MPRAQSYPDNHQDFPGKWGTSLEDLSLPLVLGCLFPFLDLRICGFFKYKCFFSCLLRVRHPSFWEVRERRNISSAIRHSLRPSGLQRRFVPTPRLRNQIVVSLCHTCATVQQGGRPSLGLGEPRFTGFDRRSTSARLNSPPVPAAAAASSPLTWKRFQDHPGGLDGAATSNLLPTQLQPQPCRSWTSVLRVDVSRTLTLRSFLFVLFWWFHWVWRLCRQPRALQPTGGLESCWVREPLDACTSAMMPILDGNWRSNRSSLIQRVQRPARWESAGLLPFTVGV